MEGEGAGQGWEKRGTTHRVVLGPSVQVHQGEGVLEVRWGIDVAGALGVLPGVTAPPGSLRRPRGA